MMSKPREYKPTLENIILTPEQEALMVQAIKHINEAPSTIKKVTRWQFWFRQIYDDGKSAADKLADKIQVSIDAMNSGDGEDVYFILNNALKEYRGNHD